MKIQKLALLALSVIVSTALYGSQKKLTEAEIIAIHAEIDARLEAKIQKKLKEAPPGTFLPKETFQILVEGKLTLEMVKKHLADGGNIEAKDLYHERTLLGWAAGFGKAEIVDFLLGKKANIEARDCHGETPLMSAIDNMHQYAHSNMPAIQLLVDREANVSAIDNAKRTIDKIIANNKHICEKFRKEGNTDPYVMYFFQAEKDGREARKYIKKSYIKNLFKHDPSNNGEAFYSLVSQYMEEPKQENGEEFYSKERAFQSLKSIIMKSAKIEQELDEQNDESDKEEDDTSWITSRQKEIHNTLLQQIGGTLAHNTALLIKKDETGYTLLRFAMYIGAKKATETIEGVTAIYNREMLSAFHGFTPLELPSARPVETPLTAAAPK